MKKKNKNQSLEESVETINSIADAFEQINEMINNGIPFDVVTEEVDSDENANFNEDVNKQDDLGFLQDEKDMDDLEFDEMNDIWDEMDEEDK